MDDPRHAADDADENFDLDWESLTFSSARSGNGESDSFDDWEERVAQDTRGYEANSATTSFTDLDLSDALVDLRNTPEWADLASWSDD